MTVLIFTDWDKSDIDTSSQEYLLQYRPLYHNKHREKVHLYCLLLIVIGFGIEEVLQEAVVVDQIIGL